MNSHIWTSLSGQVGPHLQAELDALIASNGFYPYVRDQKQTGHWPPPIGDKEVIYCCYGALDSNRLYGTMIVDGVTHYGSIASPVAWPTMQDRLFGMDREDAAVFSWLTDLLCSLHIEGKTKEQVMARWDRDWNQLYPDKPLGKVDTTASSPDDEPAAQSV